MPSDRSHNNSTHLANRILNRLGVLFLVLCLVYIYFVSATTIAIAEGRSFNKKISETKAMIADLEAQYFATVGKIDTKRAAELGFTLAESYAFVSLSESSSLALLQQ